MPVKENLDETVSIASDVLLGLTSLPKTLPPRLFYDARGSELFEEITRLPEYYLTRTERGILENNAAEIIAAAGSHLTLIELGAGTASKTSILIRALLGRQTKAVYCPVDVSAMALEVALRELNGSFPPLEVRPVVADYSLGLEQLLQLPGKKLVIYIGSSIGNFHPPEAGAMLRRVSDTLRAGDALLLGVDMLKKPSILLAAYDDSQGVTACFNKNILARINRELGATFDLDSFRHVACWNAAESRIEIHLESLKFQVIRIAALDLTVSFQLGERLHTENSYKFTTAMVEEVLRKGGFKLERSWFDPNEWFGVYLARV